MRAGTGEKKNDYGLNDLFCAEEFYKVSQFEKIGLVMAKVFFLFES